MRQQLVAAAIAGGHRRQQTAEANVGQATARAVITGSTRSLPAARTVAAGGVGKAPPTPVS